MITNSRRVGQTTFRNQPLILVALFSSSFHNKRKRLFLVMLPAIVSTNTKKSRQNERSLNVNKVSREFFHDIYSTSNSAFDLNKIMSKFDIFEQLLKHGLEHIIEEILLLLPLEDLLCRVNVVSR